MTGLGQQDGPSEAAGYTLELAYFATGAYQHVFLCPGQDEWVYKIPAAFGYVLPFDQPVQYLWPKSASQRLVNRLFLAAPLLLRRRLYTPYFSTDRNLAFPLSGGIRIVVDRSTNTVVKAGMRMAAAYWRRTRLRQFSRMLDMIDVVARSGLGDLLLPHEVVRRGCAMLCVGGRRLPYSGPMLIQRKVTLFEEGVVFDHAPWWEVVKAQHRLWREGFGLWGSAEILGLRSWALHDGRVYLADTSSLTRDVELARRNLRSEALEMAAAKVERTLNAGGDTKSIAKYVQSIRREINEDRFGELWGSAVGRLQRPARRG